MRPSYDWKLTNICQTALRQHFGAVRVHHFATKTTALSRHYISSLGDSFSRGQALHTICGPNGLLTPPPHYLQLIARKLNAFSHGRLAVVASYWPAQPWFQSLSRIASVHFPLGKPGWRKESRASLNGQEFCNTTHCNRLTNAQSWAARSKRIGQHRFGTQRGTARAAALLGSSMAITSAGGYNS